MRFPGPFVTLIAVAIFLSLAGVACSNPADNKPEAEVSEAEAVPDTAGDAVVFDVAPEQSFVNFVGSTITGSHNGGFHVFDGEIRLVDNDPTASSVMMEIDTTSLWSDDERLTKHLKSPDFFEVETFPTAMFESTSIEATDEGYMVTGNLDLHGVKKSVSFPAQITVSPDSITTEAEFFIKRFDFDIVYPGKPDDLIRDEVVIHFELTGVP
jgi:polyisoprenoid-binding protein YceI